jgi:hypothetical protein
LYLGIQGKIVTEAIELRQKLVGLELRKHPTEVKENLEVIKRKAYLTNLMISRDMESLVKEVDTLKAHRDDWFSTIGEGMPQ